MPRSKHNAHMTIPDEYQTLVLVLNAEGQKSGPSDDHVRHFTRLTSPDWMESVCFGPLSQVTLGQDMHGWIDTAAILRNYDTLPYLSMDVRPTKWLRIAEAYRMLLANLPRTRSFSLERRLPRDFPIRSLLDTLRRWTVTYYPGQCMPTGCLWSLHLYTSGWSIVEIAKLVDIVVNSSVEVIVLDEGHERYSSEQRSTPAVYHPRGRQFQLCAVIHHVKSASYMNKAVLKARRYAESPSGIVLDGRKYWPRKPSPLLRLPYELRKMIADYVTQ